MSTDRMHPEPLQHLRTWTLTFANTVDSIAPQVDGHLKAAATGASAREDWESAELAFRRIEDRFQEVQTALRMAKRHLHACGMKNRGGSMMVWARRPARGRGHA